MIVYAALRDGGQCCGECLQKRCIAGAAVLGLEESEDRRLREFRRAAQAAISEIDRAKKGVGGNQKFKFIGKHDFHDTKGELRYEDKGAKVVVQGDVNGDGKADFEILVKLGSLEKGDFIL